MTKIDEMMLDFETTFNKLDIDEVDNLMKKNKGYSEYCEINVKDGLKDSVIKHLKTIENDKNVKILSITYEKFNDKNNKVYIWADLIPSSKRIYEGSEDVLEIAKYIDIREVVGSYRQHGDWVYSNDTDVVFYQTRDSKWRYKNFKTNENGSNVDFMMNYKDMTMKQAIIELLKHKEDNFSNTEHPEKTVIDFEQYILDNKNNNNYGTWRYLVLIRKIDGNIFKDLYNKGYIFRDCNMYNEECNKNIGKDTTLTYFVYKDPFNGQVVGLTGRENRDVAKMKQHWDDKKQKMVNGEPFRRNFTGCKWGFNIMNGNPSTMTIFEAPIDLLSYMTIYKNDKDKLNNNILIATGGTNRTLIMDNIKILKEKGLKRIVVATDNDKTGEETYQWVKETFEKEGLIVDREKPANKDWNDDLIKGVK